MKAVIVKSERLVIEEVKKPEPKENEILVKVAATALNRADLLQKRGKYPPPAGASDILGLEIAGVVEAVGANISKWYIGDRVFGLLPGGGYAAYAVIHEEMAMAIPEDLSFAEAAAIPEVFLTAFQAIHWLAKLQPEENILIHAGGSGVGTAAIQIAKDMKAKVIITASAKKHDICRKLGAQHMIDYHTQDFGEEIARLTDKRGVDVIIDFIGADYFSNNISSLARDGRLVLLAVMSGSKVDADLSQILLKRLSIMGSTLRSRSLAYQIALTREFWSYAEERFINRKFKPVIDKIYSWENAEEAHQQMEQNLNTGKIILRIE